MLKKTSKKLHDVLQDAEDKAVEISNISNNSYKKQKDLPSGKLAIAAIGRIIAIQALKIKKGKL